ncbi:MAG: DNA mismatch repair endonuclease MutL [Lachnospiraceae bacterium]|nr:DNA mismatch repair endonuclease MutL [Lachnospiraceae bacterium]
MGIINVLDENTINLIAAGEVVEKPASVVKELVENAMDSGADSITIEIKQGGIEFIRISDNGSGIARDDIPTAFLRHATSKIKDASDLILVASMGFRGEALSSISAVSKVELITKQRQDLMGSRYTIEGGKTGEVEEVGAPNGTTIIVRNLFYNTPARRKFLKSEMAEANAISDVVQHLALGRPDISFKYIVNNKVKLQTTGKADVKEIIYRIYGKEISDEVIPIEYEEGDNKVAGFIGTPAINRSNRNFETYFVNNRYIQSSTISSGIEEGYKEYLMQHKFPFCVLHIDMDFTALDVNVHPAKLEVRFNDNLHFQEFITRAIAYTLKNREMISSVSLDEKQSKSTNVSYEKSPEFFEEERISETTLALEEQATDNQLSEKISNDMASVAESQTDDVIDKKIPKEERFIFSVDFDDDNDQPVVVEKKDVTIPKDVSEKVELIDVTNTKPEQLSMFTEDRVLSSEARARYKLIGHVFDAYWIMEYADSVYFIDQHAAHEKVNYERIMKRVENDEKLTQYLNPPIVVTLTGSELTVFNDNKEYFEKIGFECEEFGGSEVAITGIPSELFCNTPKEMFLDILEELGENKHNSTPKVILQRIATMACKASVKGGRKISVAEMTELIDEMLTLDNPYHCPHGRPTIFSMSKYELEKKFKRIVD